MTDQIDRIRESLGDRYTIERELGAGGMATVYLAHDVKHDRKVAVKVLRPELAAIIGAERFLAEIKVTANLQHPHILPLFDSGRAVRRYGGTAADEPAEFLYYVMPYVQGESLRDKLDREKQLAVDEALEITKSVASALDYAHRQNVIHRDIKPENILLHDGQPIVADFGIALAVTAAGGTRLTETGLSLGTPQYMSPEQATADREIDGRSDIYSLACVLYEMLAGDPPHTGSTVQAVIAKVVTDDPRPIGELRNTVSDQVGAAVMVALSKLPADRFATPREFNNALSGEHHPRLLDRAGRHRPAPADGVTGFGVWLRTPFTLGFMVVAAVLLAFLVVVLQSDAPGNGRVWRAQVAPPDSTELVFLTSSPWGDTRRTIALSQDGHLIAFVARGEGAPILWIRDLLTGEVTPLSGTEGAYQPFFSPDNSEVAFFSGRMLRKVSTAGGMVQDLGEFTVPFGGTWSPERGVVISVAGQGIVRVPVSGGRVEVLNPGNSFGRCVEPQYVDAGVLCSSPFGIPFVAAVEADTSWSLQISGSNRSELEAQLRANACVVPQGEEIFCVGPSGILRALRLLEGGISVGDTASVVAEGVRTEQALAPNAQLAVSAGGAIAFVPGPSAALTQLVRTATDGSLDTLQFPVDAYGAVQTSMDGNRVAVARQAYGVSELRLLDLETGQSVTALTTEAETGISWFRWLPDDSSLWIAVGLNQESETILLHPGTTNPPDTIARGLSISDVDRPESSLLVYQAGDIRLVPFSSEGRQGDGRLLVGGPGSQSRGALSPDRRWVVFLSDEGGALEVYVQEYPEGERRFKVSLGDGYEPGWFIDGSVFYRSGETVYRVPRLGDGFGPSEVLTELPGFVDTPGYSYDVDERGRVLFVQMSAPPVARSIELIVSSHLPMR